MSVDFSKLTVLSIDDNVNMRRLVRSIMRNFGVRQVLEAEDGADAMKVLLLSPDPVDLIICDWNMKGVDGHGFLKELRSDPEAPWALIPVIMLTAHTEISVVEMARDAGVDAFLGKPVSPRDMLARMKQVLEKPKDFIVGHSYKGPDRRGRRDAPAEQERRGPVSRTEVQHEDRKLVYIEK